MRGRAAQGDHGHSARVEVELSLDAYRATGSVARGGTGEPTLKVKVFVNHIQMRMMERNNEFPRMRQEVLKKLMEETDKLGLCLSFTSESEGVDLADSVETLEFTSGRGPNSWCQRKSEEKEVQPEVRHLQEEQSFPQRLHGGGARKLLSLGMVLARVSGGTALGNSPNERLRL